MPLRTSAISEAERQAIEAEWNTGQSVQLALLDVHNTDTLLTHLLLPERSYSLSNLATTRRNGLRFVKAVKTDEEWTRDSRAGVSGSLTYKSKTSREIAAENAKWYRNLVSGSSGNSTREQSLSAAEEASTDPQTTNASTSKVTLDDLARQGGQAVVNGEGSKDQPYTLKDEEEEDNNAVETELDAMQSSISTDGPTLPASQSDHRHQACDSKPPDGLGSASEDTADACKSDRMENEDISTSKSDPAVQDVQDMYCLLCKIEVPAADVAGHRTSILHQLSKNSAKDDKPLVPPTHYGVKSSNVGYGMLQRLGWTEDTGLGSTQAGRKAPLKASDKHDRKGLGVDSKRRLEQEEREGKIIKRSKQVPQAAAKPLAKNRKELERAKKREMQMFKEGLAYLNT